jgi:hypothetical protein
VITTLRQKISDAEKAGVREVPLSNLRRLIDQIEQEISADQAKLPIKLDAAMVSRNPTQAA